MMPASVKRLMLEEKGGKSFKTEFAVVNKCNRVKERGGSHTSSFPVPLRSKRHHQFRQLRFLYCNGIKTRRIQDVLIELYLRYVYFKQGRYGGSNIDRTSVINTITYIFLESPCPEVLPLIFIFKKIS